jgi:ATP-dependent Lhr-like helicase
LPLHLFAQQVMGLLLQEGALVRSDWTHWLWRLPCFRSIPKPELESVIDHMLDQRILFADSGILSFGPEGERQFGFRHFAELFSIFQSPPLFQVLHGRSEVGYVHQTSFQVRNQGTPVLLLGGRGWLVKFVDWKRRIAYVEPSAERGRSRWIGQSPPLHFKLCQSMREVLLSEPMLGQRTKRATEQLATVQSSFAWLTGAETATWWTFAGQLANAALAETLRGAAPARVNNLALAFDGRVSAESLTQELTAHAENSYRPEFSEDAIEGLKFHECLPSSSVREELERRLCDKEAIAETLRAPRREVFLTESTDAAEET